MQIRRVLVTGGAGYIGSHTCVELLAQGYDVVCADNFANSSPEVLGRVEAVAGRPLDFHTVDFCRREEVLELFARERIDAAIHFAGLKAVGESVAEPLRYYENNLLSLINLVHGMQGAGGGQAAAGKNIVFSSSATVYGPGNAPPFAEDAALAATSPYGRTKLLAEQILQDLQASDPAWNVSLLRYFNPVGAHPSGLIGEEPRGVPNNLMPYLVQAAAGRLPKLRVFGSDYPTPDGTGVRDFIHVVDLTRGHIAALRRLEQEPGLMVHNLGTGRGVSVLELVRAFERVNGVAVPFEIAGRRPGDVAACWAATDKARKELGWAATLGIEDMVRDAWNWQVKNPSGYGS